MNVLPVYRPVHYLVDPRPFMNTALCTASSFPKPYRPHRQPPRKPNNDVSLFLIERAWCSRQCFTFGNCGLRQGSLPCDTVAKECNTGIGVVNGKKPARVEAVVHESIVVIARADISIASIVNRHGIRGLVPVQIYVPVATNILHMHNRS